MIDRNIIHKWWQTFVGDGNFTEVRVLGRFQYSGYFTKLENLISAIEPYSNMDDEQLYFVLNKIDSSCYGRQQCERMVKSPKITTNDNDIVRRQWILCDFDPIRKSGTNASEEEFELAHKKAQDVFIFLREKGFNEPVIAKSGNGWHLLYKVDFDVNDDVTDVIKRFFKYMGSTFTDDKVEFDEKNFNAARICKLYGTIAKKGANIEDRPWRMSEIVYVPKNLNTTPIEKFRELADLIPKEEPKVINRGIKNQFQQFDLKSWLNEYGIVYREKKNGGSTLYELEYCPWVDSHSDKKKWDSALFVDAQGKITFNCTHSHCKDKTWHDVRMFFEPDAYNKSYMQPQPIFIPQYQPQQRKKKYEIKDELPELGEKWLAMSSIKKVDLTQLEKVKTGFTELDKRIGGLYMSEITILSGSNSSGKSSWLNSLLLNIVQQGYKIALWSGELRSDILKTWIQMVAAGLPNLRQSQYDEGRYYVPDAIGERIDDWLDGNFFLYNNGYGTKAEQILNDMEILLKAGVKVFCLDNLMSLDVDLFDGDKNNKQKELILRIKDFAMVNQVHVIMVAHPRKVMTFLRKNDISGTSDITNAADNVFIMHRTNEDFIHAITEFYDSTKASQLRQYGNVLSVEKNRLYGVVDFMCGFHYDIASRRFKNTPDEDIHYGWEINPTQSLIEDEYGQTYQVAREIVPESKEMTFNGIVQQTSEFPFDPPTEEEAPF